MGEEEEENENEQAVACVPKNMSLLSCYREADGARLLRDNL